MIFRPLAFSCMQNLLRPDQPIDCVLSDSRQTNADSWPCRQESIRSQNWECSNKQNYNIVQHVLNRKPCNTHPSCSEMLIPIHLYTVKSVRIARLAAVVLDMKSV